MKIPSKSGSCLWCGRVLTQSGLSVKCLDASGPRPRSDEHIIPASIGGRIITDDLCKCCNDWFGQTCDHGLVKDLRIVEAAKLVGVSISDLWSSFDGTQQTATGHVVKTSVKDGSFKIQAQLKDLDQLGVAVTDGKMNPSDLRNFRARLIQRVRGHKPNLDQTELERRVDALVAAIAANPSQVHVDKVLGERWGPMVVEPSLTVGIESTPWITEWAVAKMFFHFSNLLWPDSFQGYCDTVKDYFRTFLEAQAHDAKAKSGKGIFKFESDRANPNAQHRIEGTVSPSSVTWKATFFGTVSWSFQTDISPRVPGTAPTAHGVRILVVNPISTDLQPTIEVTPLPS